MYRYLFKVEGDIGGINYWTGLLNASVYTRETMFEYFMTHQSFAGNLTLMLPNYLDQDDVCRKIENYSNIEIDTSDFLYICIFNTNNRLVEIPKGKYYINSSIEINI